jgi:hypothetical protein
VVYKDMQVGFLAEDTDHGTRELREIFKGMPAPPSKLPSANMLNLLA